MLPEYPALQAHPVATLPPLELAGQAIGVQFDWKKG